MEKVNLRSHKFKETRDSTNLSFEGDGFSWPQRNYTCSFCKKQFKSAQALGGHMNVHRRDRAKLRQSPSWVSSNPNPNFSSSPAARFLPYVSNYHSSLTPSFAPLSSQPSASTDEEKLLLNPHSQLDPVSPPLRGDVRKKLSNGAFIGVAQLKSLAQEGESRVLTKRENINVRLDLDMSLRRDAKVDLDLELRLGYS